MGACLLLSATPSVAWPGRFSLNHCGGWASLMMLVSGPLMQVSGIAKMTSCPFSSTLDSSQKVTISGNVPEQFSGECLGAPAAGKGPESPLPVQVQITQHQPTT